MRHLSKFFEYLNNDFGDNNFSADDLSDTEKLNKDDYSDIIEEITDMIENSIKIGNIKSVSDFIESYSKDPDSIQIEGLINDSDIYEFYLKWRNEIDDILSSINFYDEVPSEIKVFSLYDYIIQGTKKSVSEIISIIKE